MSPQAHKNTHTAFNTVELLYTCGLHVRAPQVTDI